MDRQTGDDRGAAVWRNYPRAAPDPETAPANRARGKGRLLHLAWRIIQQTPGVRPVRAAPSPPPGAQSCQVDAPQLSWALVGRDEVNLVSLLEKYPALIAEYLGRHSKPTARRRQALRDVLKALQARDFFSGSHSLRVTAIALRFAHYLGLPRRDLGFLKTAGYLHDLGKLRISEALLRKPGGLLPEERAAVETHPHLGDEILAPLSLRPQERELILYHHERWDGRGYPRGLAGKEIPFCCRLFALADAYEALTSPRPYRRRFSPAEAQEEIRSQASRQFDPHLVPEFLALVSAWF
jgi:HD-GYP domain-containing protein (c-di-GMP phosphodiesterase class II)